MHHALHRLASAGVEASSPPTPVCRRPDTSSSYVWSACAVPGGKSFWQWQLVKNFHVKTMNRHNTNEKVLQRLWNHIVFEKELPLNRNDMCFTDRQNYANSVISTFKESDGIIRRNATELRQIFIYKRASEKNLLAKDVYPSSHYENWMYSTIYSETQHIVAFLRIFQTFTSFLISDISCLELFAVEGLRSLPLIPTPAPSLCPLQHRSSRLDHLPLMLDRRAWPSFCAWPPTTSQPPPRISISKDLLQGKMPFGWGKKDEEREHLLECARLEAKKEERRQEQERERREEKRRRDEERAAYFGNSL